MYSEKSGGSWCSCHTQCTHTLGFVLLLPVFPGAGSLKQQAEWDPLRSERLPQTKGDQLQRQQAEWQTSGEDGQRLPDQVHPRLPQRKRKRKTGRGWRWCGGGSQRRQGEKAAAEEEEGEGGRWTGWGGGTEQDGGEGSPCFGHSYSTHSPSECRGERCSTILGVLRGQRHEPKAWECSQTVPGGSGKVKPFTWWHALDRFSGTWLMK